MGPESRFSICSLRKTMAPRNVGSVGHSRFLEWLASAGKRGQCPELTGGGVTPAPSLSRERGEQAQVPPRPPLCPAATGDPALAPEHRGSWLSLVFPKSTAPVGSSLPRAWSGRTCPTAPHGQERLFPDNEEVHPHTLVSEDPSRKFLLSSLFSL